MVDHEVLSGIETGEFNGSNRSMPPFSDFREIYPPSM